jgi:ferric-dicitrate binding protein FerR (iron transport regulator)
MQKNPKMNIDSSTKTGLFDRYLDGRLSGEEEARLGEWLIEADQNYREFKAYLSQSKHFQSHTRETNRLWNAIRDKTVARKRDLVKISGLSAWLKVAALLVVAMTAGFYIHSFMATKPATQASMNEIIVPKGQTARLILSDGTNVYLNSGSQFKYPAGFSGKDRRVSLTGEAFFDVAKNESSPFIISTGRFNVKVTGTSFNLSAYAEDNENSLTLHSGTVIVDQGEKEYMIKPGEKYTLAGSTGVAEIREADLLKSVLWKEGIVVIDNLDLGEIAKILERRFNIRITIMNEDYKKIRYAGQFKPRETLKDILELIRRSSPVKFTYKINESETEIIIQ